MPQLIRVYIKNCLIGYGIAGLFVGALIYFDVARLGHLILNSSSGWIAALILFVAFGTVFAGVQFGYAIMALAAKDEPPQSGLRQHATLMPVPVAMHLEPTRRP